MTRHGTADRGLSRSVAKKLRRPGLAAAGAGLTVVLAQAAGGLKLDQGSGSEAVAAGLIVLGIIALVYTVWNTILAWIASKIMALPESTFGRALWFTILSAIVGVCMVVLAFVVGMGVLGLTMQGLLGEDGEAASAMVVVAVLAFFVLWLLAAIVVAGWVYHIGFLRALGFLIVLWVVNIVAGVALRAAGCVNTSELPDHIPGLEQPSPRGEPA